MKRHERPIRRVNPSGKERWVARYTAPDGTRKSAGTFDLKRQAQDAIDLAYEREYADPVSPDTVGGYAASWLKRHPRSAATEKAYESRLRGVLDVEVEGRAFRLWRLDEVRRRTILDLVDVMLREKGRSAAGTRVVLSTLAAMWRDARLDERASADPFTDVRVSATDPRVQRPSREVPTWSWGQMHALCAAARTADSRTELGRWRRVYGEPMMRLLCDCGMRIGEVLALPRAGVYRDACGDQRCRLAGPHVHVGWTADDGVIREGTKTTRGRPQLWRACPMPPALFEMFGDLPPRLDSRLVFPDVRGRAWRYRAWLEAVWWPARDAAGMPAATPHSFRHSYVSLMRAAGVNPADLAEWTGHTVLTATTQYTHATGVDVELARSVIG